MSVLNLAITSGRPDSWLESNFETPGGSHSIAQRLVNYLQSLQTGTEKDAGTGNPPSIAISIQGNAVRAFCTVTFTSVVATDELSINGVAFIAVASGATEDEFDVGATDLETAQNAANAINASTTALIKGYLTAAAEEIGGQAILRITSTFWGIEGNQTTVSSTDSTFSISSPQLQAGDADPTAQTLTF